MRPWLVMAGWLLAGCATQPASPFHIASAPHDVLDDVDRHVLRIGLEHLPPDDRLPVAPPAQVERPRPPLPVNADTLSAADEPRARRPEPSRTPQLSQVDLASIDDPIARETMHFVVDLVAADRQRVRREVGIPFFDFRPTHDERDPILTSERRLLEDQEQWSQEQGTRLLQRPFRQLLRRLPIARELELAFEEFRSDHVPLTDPYEQAHDDGAGLGRMSVRMHTRDLADPVEVVYIRSGVRVGSSLTRGKLAIDLDLGGDLNLSVRARHDYGSGRTGLRADLVYRPSPHTSVHVAAGDDMDFLSTSSLYSLFESPMDGSPGVAVYAVHTF